MTYTYKLARRMAISRHLAMLLQVLMLSAACAGESTAPDPLTTETSPTAPSVPAVFRVVPKVVTAETEQEVRFRAEVDGRVHALSPDWEVTGDSVTHARIDSTGTFVATRPGTYLVIARNRTASRAAGRGRRDDRHAWTGRTTHRPDTSLVVVVPRQRSLRAIRVTPQSVQLATGDTVTLKAEGRLISGGSAPVGVTWKASGGTIDAGGHYRAGSRPGRYQIIATHAGRVLSDTVVVRVLQAETADTAAGSPPDTSAAPQPADTVATPSPAPDPEPEPDPAPTPDPKKELARVILKPASLMLSTGASHRFAAFGRTGGGDSVAVDVTFSATGGTITKTGLYTAGPTAGTYRVIAKVSGLADTAVVTLARASGGEAPTPPPPAPEPPPLPVPTGLGLPFGPTNLLENARTVAPFSMGNQAAAPSTILNILRDARARGLRVMLNMTGGSHSNYLTNGRFDRSKWNARMAGYDTPAIKKAIAEAVADGTIIGNSVMDEPHVSGGGDGNTWGPPGTMTKAIVDDMCAHVKRMFPTLPVGVVHRHDMFEPSKSYKVCDFIISQYSTRIGSVTAFRDAGLALAKRDGHAIMFSMNIINGGTQDKDGTWDCTGTPGKGTFAPSCRMSPQQIREYGKVLGPAGCGLAMWRFDSAFIANSENQKAFKELAAMLASKPGKACVRS